MQNSTILYCPVLYCTVQSGLVWFDVLYYSILLCGVVLCCVVWCVKMFLIYLLSATHFISYQFAHISSDLTSSDFLLSHLHNHCTSSPQLHVRTDDCENGIGFQQVSASCAVLTVTQIHVWFLSRTLHCPTE